MEAGEITPAMARPLFALPCTVGYNRRPEIPSSLASGDRTWLRHGARYVPLPADEDVLAAGLNRAGVLVDARIP